MVTSEAGWAEVDITPPLGLPMGGRGPRFSPGSSVLDPLKAQVMVLKDTQGRRTLWVSLDLIGLSYGIGKVLRRDLASITAIPLESVIINSAHVHSGPMTSFDDYATYRKKPGKLRGYEEERDKRILRAAHVASQSLEPVKVTVHRGRSDLGINRRLTDENGITSMRPDPKGVYNPDLWVLDIAGDGRRAVVFSYGCHPVIVYGYSWDGISADYPGAVRMRVKRKLGKKVHVQFMQGLAGDVRPRILANAHERKFRTSTPKDLDRAGRILSADIVRTVEAPGRAVELSLCGVSGSFLAPRDQGRIPPLDHWEELAKREDDLWRNVGRYWSERLRHGPPPAKAVPWDIGLLRLGPDDLIAWFAGEPVAEWQGHLRRWLADENLTVWGYCQYVSDYLPTDELIPLGGYEVVDSNQYGKTGPGPFAQGLNDSAREGFRSLKGRLDLTFGA